MMDASGQIRNSYQYDPFGKVVQQTEQVRNLYKYIGRLGVISDEELQHVFMMRDRHYDAQHGRFISMDPIGNQQHSLYMYSVHLNLASLSSRIVFSTCTGLSGNSPNLYVYAFNSPLVLKDPTGRIIPLGVIAAAAVIHVARQVAIGTAVSVATYAVTTAITPGSDFSTGGIRKQKFGMQ